MSTVKETLIELGYSITSETSTHYRMSPLYRQSNSRGVLSVHKESGAFVDFAAQISGSLDYLRSLTLGVPMHFLEKSELDTKVSENSELKQDIPIVFGSEVIKTLLPSYSFYIKRGISVELLKELKAGLCTAGKLYDRFVFPILGKNGEIQGLAGRDVTDKKDSKWKKLAPSSKWCYPYYFVKNDILEKQEVILVESIGDMLALMNAGFRQVLVVFGVSIGKELLSTLIEINPKRILIALNNDIKEDGSNPGKVGAEKLKLKLDKWFDSSKVMIHLPEKGDFGDCKTKKEIEDWYAKV